MSAPAASSTCHLLIVDDDPVSRDLCAATLETNGYKTTCVASAEQAMLKLRDLIPDLVLLDLVLPGLDGFEFARVLRRNPATSRVPVVFLSGMTSKETRLAAFDMGGADFMAKPFTPEELLHRVSNALERTTVPPPAVERAVSGQLAEFGLPSLLMVLELERKSGVLTVQRSDALIELQMRDGQLLGAQQRAGGNRRNMEALRHSLAWSDGTFSFDPGACEGQSVFNRSTTHVLLEATRKNDESEPDPS